MIDETLSKAWSSSVEHFIPQEFDSPDLKDSGYKMNLAFVQLLDQLRKRCGFPITVSSGYRTPEHNQKVGGVDASAHEEGVACDILVGSGTERMAIVKNAIAIGIGRIGVGKGLIHIDISFSLPQNVMWAYTNK